MDTERLADWVALTELKASYFRYLDTKQWEKWRALFTEDLNFYNDTVALPTSTEPMAEGRENFVTMVSGMLEHAVTVHQGHMPEIAFTGDRTASGIWAMYDWVDAPGESGWNNQGFGHYHERYEKGDDGKWRIAELRLTRLRVDSAGPVRADVVG
jgi:SnoaL-like domain